VLLSLLVGVSRTMFAMAAERDLPHVLVHVHPRTKVPDLAEIAVGTIVFIVVLTSDVRHAIGFSSFCVLGYYAITNAAALRLPRGQRRWPAAIAVFGLAGCVVLAVTLPVASIATGTVAVAFGLIVRAILLALTPADRS
jgi:APA family basic amino acid/polyamine antiporter